MTDTENLPALPEGWCWTILDDVILKISNGTTANQNKEKKGIPVTRIESISTGSLDLERVGYLEDVSTEIIEKYKLQSQDILFSHINSDLHLGKSAIYTFENFTLLHGMNLLLIRPFNSHLSSKFLNYLFNYYRFSGFFISIAQHAVNQSSINQRKLKNIEIPLPPLPEQHRIVQKIEEFFTDLEAGVKELEKAKVQIKNYKKAVLKAAFMGDLTEEWREKNIFADSESSLISKTKTQKGSPENLCYFELPENWFWTNLQELGIVSGGVTKNSKRNSFPEEIPYLRVANVYSNHLELEEMKCIGVREEEIERYLLKKGDLLVVEGNGSLDQIGRVALWDGSIPKCIHQNHIIKVRFNNPEVGKYVLFWLLSIEGRKNITLVASSTSGLYTLSISKVSSLPVPLAPLSEQKVIVSEIERCFSVIDQIEKIIDQSLTQAEKLRQSILKKAFEGKLVPQDPNDEPASVLLEKIKQKKGRAETRKKPGKGRRMKAETIIEVSGNTKQVELF